MSLDGFANRQPAFVDFGCGRGDSLRFGESLMQGAGIGMDSDRAKVAAARAAGHDVLLGDVLASELRGVAPAAICIDVMPELDGRRAFETALAGMLRAARDFALVQHLCFDSAETLLGRGLLAAGHTDKSIRWRPRIADYAYFVQAFASRLDIVGFAAFGVGEAKTTASALPDLRGPLLTRAEGRPVYRSVRIILGRKTAPRFRDALRRAATGEALAVWEAAS